MTLRTCLHGEQAAQGACWLAGPVVSALPLQCITGRGLCARGLAKVNLIKPARQSEARLQDAESERTAGLQRAPILWPFLGGRALHSGQRRQDSVWANQLSSLEVLNCWPGGQGHPPDGPHRSHSCKKKKKKKQRRAQ